jgi:cell division protein FtsI/penicillin-binding protein 2
MNSSGGRIVAVMIVLGLLFAAVIARLFVIQVIDAGRYAELCKRQSRQRLVVPSQRGKIYDCKGRILAAGAGDRVRLSPDLLMMDAADSALTIGHGRPHIAAAIRRIYPFGDLAGAVLGYVGRDGYGLAGAEFAFDKNLRGEDGWTIVHRDGRQVLWSTAGLPSKQPVAGGDVYLTVDIDIQKIAQTVLGQTVQAMRAKNGMCMIMDPLSGAVLAMASEPAFNPNLWELYPADRRQNRCLEINYEPGSTFKIIAAASALQDNVLREQDLIDGGNGVYRIYNESIRDREPFGKITFAEALAYSSNVCFAKVANAVGSERLYKYAKNFGFGSCTGIQLPGEESGIVHPMADWSGRTRVTMAIGQEVSVTFLQMMLAFACIANDGVLVKPSICEKIVASDGTVAWQKRPAPVRRILLAGVARRLRYMMKAVIDKGTGVRAQIDGVPAAGKTGTAQKFDEATKTYSATRYSSSFIGMVPVESPALVCGVLIDEPSAGEGGGIAAAPAFKKIITQILTHPNLTYADRILRRDPMTASADSAAGARPAAMSAGPAHRAVAAASGGKLAVVGGLPDYAGRDARDAALDVLARGVVPYVFGKGAVVRQFPEAGAIKADACTLYCAVGG